MVRRYGEDVEVARDSAGAPTGFRWRSGRYVVHDVLAQWRERRAWWTSPSALMLHGGETAGSTGSAGAGSVAADLATERLVWRVEAGPARYGAARRGVYDLCLEVAGGDRGVRGVSETAAASSEVLPWRLLRVVD